MQNNTSHRSKLPKKPVNDFPQLQLAAPLKKDGPIISSSFDAHCFLMQISNEDDLYLQEHVYAIYLNGVNRVVGWRLLNIGNVSSTQVDTHLMLAAGLLCRSRKIILAHNHPTGELKLSTEDEKIYKQYDLLLASFQFELTDFVIFSPDGIYSKRGEFGYQLYAKKCMRTLRRVV